jgi:fatty-acyl-CoA synthase
VTDDPTHGRLEGTALSPVFRFKSDLAARVRAEGAGARIDLRAVSRVGQSDRGMNCALVTGLVQALQG